MLKDLRNKKLSEIKTNDLIFNNDLRDHFFKEFSFYPIWDNEKESLSFIDPVTPLQIVSERPLDEVKTLMWTNMPVPRVLPVFLQALKQINIKSNNRILVVRSDPGMGKTHTARLLAEVMSKEDPVIFDCGDKDLNNLLFTAEIDTNKDNAFGLRMVHGPLIEAWKAGRTIILDEITKAKPGTSNGLQTLLQFLNGEDNICTVYNEMSNNMDEDKEFVFKREDMGAGFFVIATGNNVEDGPYEAKFTQSFISRINPIDLSYPKKIDWEHRICTAMMGVPVSTIHFLFKDKKDYDENLLGKWMMDLRKGRAEIEDRAVPDSEMFLLEHWKESLAASKILASFFDKWSILTDVNREEKKNNFDVNIYPREKQPDFRMVVRIWRDVLDIVPRPENKNGPEININQNINNFFNSAAMDSRTDISENPMDHLGSRLVDRIRKEIQERVPYEKYPLLYKELMKIGENVGVFNTILQEGAFNETNRSLEEILNFANKNTIINIFNMITIVQKENKPSILSITP